MKDLVIFDCDGVIYRGKQTLPHVRETFQALRNSSIPIRFITNNSTKTRPMLADKIRGFGVDASPDEIHATAYAVRLHLEATARPDARIFIMGETGLRRELRNYTLLPMDRAEEADYVIVGMDRKISYRKLTAAVLAVQAGAELIATNRDATFPIEGGRIVPGGGTMVAAVETAAGPARLTMGKPEPHMLHQLLQDAGVRPSRALLVGDRADTDIMAGRRARMKTCLVLTGVTQPHEVPHLPPQQRPHYVAKTLRQVAGLLGVSRAKPAAPFKDYRPPSGAKKE